MSTAPPTLADLRRRIDGLDDRLHDVLMERAAVVESIGRLKRADSTPSLRPGREAQILRRLLARHRGAFPKPILVRLWRELLAGSLAIQADLHIAVYAPQKSAGLWDLARDHYGSQTAMSGFPSTGEVLRALADRRAALGVLPVPGPSEIEPWWRAVAASEAPVLRIIARLPFSAPGNARSDDGAAFVVGAVEPEESGADRSLYVIETGRAVSRARLLNALGSVGWAASVLASADANGAASQLVEFDSWIAGDDARLKDALGGLGDQVLRCTWLGAYAQPLSAAELGG